MTDSKDLSSLEAVADSWSTYDDEVVATGIWTMARQLPSMFGRVLGECWRASRRDTLILCIGTVIAEALTAVGLFATASVLDNLLIAGPTPDRLRAAMPSLLVVVVAIVVRAGLQQITRWTSQRLSPQLRRGVSAKLVERATDVELAAFDDAEFRDALHRVSEQAPNAVSTFLELGLRQVGSFFSLIAVGGVLTVLHPVLLPLLALAVVPVWWASMRRARLVYTFYDAVSGPRRRMDTLYELMTERAPAAEIRAYTMRGFLVENYRTLSGYVLDKELRMNRREVVTDTVGDGLAGLGVAVVYVSLAALLYTERMELAIAGTAVIAIRTALSGLGEIAGSMNATYEHALYYQDYTEFLAAADHRAERRGGAAPPVELDRITMRGVDFTYPSGAERALRGVDIDIEPGQIIALVGENGSGKTTLAKLISGLYAPQAGRIEYGGVGADDVDLARLRDGIAVVAQDFTHWPFTAGENITIGRTGHTDSAAQLNWATEASGADRVLQRLPKGADTLLDPSYVGGVDLSGGQWQRIAVARGFYRDASLLICDEPTAALDARTEHEIFETIRQHAAQRTVVLITHRLANVRYADRIYVMDQGRVVDSGTHAELMSHEGIYREFYTLQADAYRDAEPDDRPEDQPDEG